jgi:hypothetical protein
MSAWVGALLLLAPFAAAAQAQNAECERSAREQAAIARKLESEKFDVTRYQSELVKLEFSKIFPNSQAHFRESIRQGKMIISALEITLATVTFDVWAACDKAAPAPTAPPQTATSPAPPPPSQATPSPPVGLAPNQGVYALKGTLGPCGSLSGATPLDFAINNGRVTGSYNVTAGVARIAGTVDNEGTLHVKLESDPESMFGGKIIWQNGHWRATGRYNYISKLFNCSAVWSATQANPS